MAWGGVEWRAGSGHVVETGEWRRETGSETRGNGVDARRRVGAVGLRGLVVLLAAE